MTKELKEPRADQMRELRHGPKEKTRDYKGFRIKRDKDGKGFSLMMHKKIKGFEEETDMQDNETIEEEDVEFEQPPVADLVAYAVEQKPIEFSQTFADIMQQKISDAVYEKKLEVAAGYAGAEPEQEYIDTDDEEDVEVEAEDLPEEVLDIFEAYENDEISDEDFDDAIEQLDEISKYTLKDFIKKASKDIGTRAYNVGLKGGPDAPGAKVDAMKAEKHAKYIPKAVHRLTGKYYPKYVRVRSPSHGGHRKYEGAYNSRDFYQPSGTDRAKAANRGVPAKWEMPWSYKDMGDRKRWPRKMGRRGPYKDNE